MVAKAVEQWRSTPPGKGHDGFFVLAGALYRAGLELFEVKMELQQEAAYARPPKERRREIDDIIKKFGKRGSIGGR